jgi:hypothetical protein
MTEFTVTNGSVWMVGNHKPCRLTDSMVDRLLDFYEDAGCVELFNALYEAQREAMGDLFIERVSVLERKQDAHRVLMAQLRGSLMILQGGRR